MFNPLTLISSAFGGIYGYLAAAGIALVIGIYGGYHWEHSEVLKLQLASAENTISAVRGAQVVQKHEDEVAIAAAVKEASQQTQIITRTITVTKEIPTYVHDQIRCPGPTVGLARILRAAAAGTDPATLQLAPGQSDDDCSDVTASEVAGWFTSYASAAQANTEQLSALQQWVLDDHKAQVVP